eukprot:gene4787-6714_t
MKLSFFAYQLYRYITLLIVRYLDFIMYDLLFAGGIIYYVLDLVYRLFFNYLYRQQDKSSKISSLNNKMVSSLGISSTILNDWENPEVICRKRVDISCRTHSKNDENEENKYFLTGKCGKPDPLKMWKFMLVGDPSRAPLGWESEDYIMLEKDHNLANTEQIWHDVSLPNHWQLQGYDVPLYTNTSYPFQFNPPYVARNGDWIITDCDNGLGYNQVPTNKTENNRNLLINPNEPLGHNATGLFRHNFCLPDAWKIQNNVQNERFFLVFEGVDSCVSVWLNGIFVGYSQDSCLPAEFDVTDIINSASNSQINRDSIQLTLTVRVMRWCDGSYLEDQDKWWLSGIYREVYISRKPAASISDFEFKYDIYFESEDNTKCHVVDYNISVLFEGVTLDGSMFLCSQIIDLNTNTILSELTSSITPGSVLPGKEEANKLITNKSSECNPISLDSPGIAIVKGQLQAPLLWSAECPALYKIKLILQQNDNNIIQSETIKLLHSIDSKFGFRKVHIDKKSGQLLINNKVIIIAGVNRHEFDCETGRSVSYESMRKDAILLKLLNFNAVRCSHYPPHHYWFQICDEIGLYVIDEANIETHGFQVVGQPVGYLSHQLQWRDALLTRVTRMYERDKNYTCIIGWSLGNESGFGPTHQLMANWLRMRDKMRFVQYESGGARTTGTDIICPMYQRIDWCKNNGKSIWNKRPVILCEYAHAMGNSGGSLAKYWSTFRDDNHPRLQGGFIWDFIDQGLKLPILNSNNNNNYGNSNVNNICVSKRRNIRFGYGGDFNDNPHTGNFCCNGIVSPTRSLYPTALEVHFLQAPVEIKLIAKSNNNDTNIIQSNLVVKNRRFHSNLDDLTLVIITCIQYCYNVPLYRSASFAISLHNISAGATGNIDINKFIQDSLDAFNNSNQKSTSKDFNKNELFKMTPEVWLDIVIKSENNHIYKELDGDYPNEVLRTTVTNKLFSNYIINNISIHHNSTQKQVNNIENKLLYYDDIHENMNVIRVKWNKYFEATIGKDCGRLLTWTTTNPTNNRDNKPVDLLMKPLDVCLYRAPTDNDKGGGNLSYDHRWKQDGLNCLVRTKLSNNNSTNNNNNNNHNKNKNNSKIKCDYSDDGSLVVHMNWKLAPCPSQSEDVVCLNRNINCEMEYIFYKNGCIQIKSIITFPNLLAAPPRVGIRFATNSLFDKVDWFGLGPHEAYDDRKSSVYLGQFTKTVEQLHTDYMRPQECGRRADPRWIQFASHHDNVRDSAQGLSILINPQSLSEYKQQGFLKFDESRIQNKKEIKFNQNHGINDNVYGYGFSASKYSLENYMRSNHEYELFEEDSNCTHIHIDSHMMGVGGYDSWSPNVDEEYQIDCKQPLVTKFVLQPWTLL